MTPTQKENRQIKKEGETRTASPRSYPRPGQTEELSMAPHVQRLSHCLSILSNTPRSQVSSSTFPWSRQQVMGCSLADPELGTFLGEATRSAAASSAASYFCPALPCAFCLSPCPPTPPQPHLPTPFTLEREWQRGKHVCSRCHLTKTPFSSGGFGVLGRTVTLRPICNMECLHMQKRHHFWYIH